MGILISICDDCYKIDVSSNDETDKTDENDLKPILKTNLKTSDPPYKSYTTQRAITFETNENMYSKPRPKPYYH